MKALQTLPDGYAQIAHIDLMKNKKEMLLVNIAALLIAAVMAVPMHFHISFVTLFDLSDGLWLYFLRFVVMLGGICLYLVLHELVHGIAMKLCGTKKIRYGFTGLYAFAGSTDYYDRPHYRFIALAPVVLWGIVLAVLNALVPAGWFWVVYIIQIANIYGAAGDFYVTVRMARMPASLLVQDSGISMTVYAPQS